MQISDPINQRQSITSQLRNVDNPTPNRSLNASLHRLPLKPFATRGFIGQSGANPCLNITHCEIEIAATELRHLGNGSSEGVDRVTQFFQTVVKSRDISGGEAMGVRKLEDLSGGGLDGGEGNGESGGGQKAGTCLDGIGMD
ncbi:hypothetical protein E6C27_scaffold70G00470 [Cucumis melo var. makuwa]|uniref:Uncharacterized protein n=1 Tax=Cucumis melo var. makuwa TaxID=1194695 RepID=A0A5A7VKH2_CUCMM|nr:hypothetical protein E6C27_scaffold70G00470 [Cucumis melo var. makuwa]